MMLGGIEGQMSLKMRYQGCTYQAQQVLIVDDALFLTRGFGAVDGQLLLFAVPLARSEAVATMAAKYRTAGDLMLVDIAAAGRIYTPLMWSTAADGSIIVVMSM